MYCSTARNNARQCQSHAKLKRDKREKNANDPSMTKARIECSFCWQVKHFFSAAPTRQCNIESETQNGKHLQKQKQMKKRRSRTSVLVELANSPGFLDQLPSC
jgi:hypothetical protein